ncbi:hypothetical protein KJZ99_02135 [bacterium]|nr:hypothetical protein [bacterium]
MKDTVKVTASQAETLQDFTPQQVANILGRSRSWVMKHRHLFVEYPVPGRGKTATEVRFTRKSVAVYVEHLRSAANGNGAEEHESVEQIINRVKAKRAAAGQSL